MRGPPKATRGKCERGHESANADGAGAEGCAGDGCSQGASFGPMAAISRRGQGGRIYNNTRARVLQRRMCVKLADLTTHSPPKTSARPHAATRPSRALPLAHAAPTHACRSHNTFPAEDLLPPPHNDTPFPHSDDARPPTSQHIPRRRYAPAPAQRRALPEPFLTPAQRRCTPADLTTHSPPKTFALPAHFHSSSQRRRTPAGCAMHSSPPSQHIPHRRPSPVPAQRHALPAALRFGHKKNGTAQCMCDAECLGRPSLRSVIWVGEPRAVRRRCGALACRRGA